MGQGSSGGVNQYPKTCNACGATIPPGSGILRKKGGARMKWQSKWIIEHPDCPGARPWMLENDGWIYAITGAKPDGTGIKVGMTGTGLNNRIVPQLVRGLFPISFRVKDVAVWGCPTQSRYAS